MEHKAGCMFCKIYNDCKYADLEKVLCSYIVKELTIYKPKKKEKS